MQLSVPYELSGHLIQLVPFHVPFSHIVRHAVDPGADTVRGAHGMQLDPFSNVLAGQTVQFEEPSYDTEPLGHGTHTLLFQYVLAEQLVHLLSSKIVGDRHSCLEPSPGQAWSAGHTMAHLHMYVPQFS